MNFLKVTLLIVVVSIAFVFVGGCAISRETRMSIGLFKDVEGSSSGTHTASIKRPARD